MDGKQSQNKMGGGNKSNTNNNTNNAIIFTQSNEMNGDPDAPLIPFGRHRDEDGNIPQCRFISRLKSLGLVQIFVGLVLFAAGLYTHFPVFSGGFRLIAGEDRLWYATWVGLVNVLTGIIGRLASKRSIGDRLHTLLRRTYFLCNAAFCFYPNGLGTAAYFISLSHYNLITPNEDQTFTTVMAFVCIILCIVCIVLNIIGVLYQVLATKQCKCWVCDPKTRRMGNILTSFT